MSCTSRYCRCCYSFEGLENLCNRALDTYSLIYRPQGHENNNTDIVACFRCLEFLKRIYRFKFEDPEVNIKPNKAELRLQNTVIANSSQVGIKEETEDEYDAVNKIDIQINKVEASYDSESLNIPEASKTHVQINLNECDKPYKCSKCSYTATTEGYLKSHIAFKHSNDDLLKCDQCNYRGKNKALTSVHRMGHLNDRDKPFKCDKCSYATTTKGNLKWHNVYKHSDEKPFSCDQCQYRCKGKASLEVHKRTHLKESDRPYKCSECSYRTTTKGNLKIHTAYKHSDENPYKCTQCSYCTKNKSLLSIHIINHLNDSDKPYKCSQCSYTTTTDRKLKSHIAIKHSDEKPFTCDQCNYQCKGRRTLTTHILSHLNDCDKPFKCNECSFTTITSGQLKMHVVHKHSDEKPFVCDWCNYRCKTKSRLYIHVKAHMSHDNKCIECPFTSKTKGSLKRHTNNKHSNKKRFSCDQCDFRGRGKNSLSIHKRSHTSYGHIYENTNSQDHCEFKYKPIRQYTRKTIDK